MIENAKTPVVGYVRCSTDKQDYSIPDQKKAITEFANRLGYEITEWFVDEGKSGVGMEHRRALVRMLELVGREQADFKYILVYDVSRWGRYGDPDEAAYWEYHCKRCGVEVLYITENFPEDNQMATAMLKMMKRVEAGEYSRKLSHLATRGSRTAAEHGFWNGATAPYGYKRLLVDDKGNPVKVLEKGERKYQKNWKVKLTPGDRRKINIVRKIFDLYVNKDIGLKAICSTLNREGIPSPKGGKWGITIIHRILSNEVYTGTLIWGKTKKGKFAMAENTWGDSNPTKTFHDKDFWVVCVNAHEAIIDRDFFEKARILANARNRFGTNSIGRPQDSPYLLTGLMFCRKCLNRFIGHSLKNNGRTYQYYIDAGNHFKGSSLCPGLGFVPRAKVDDFVIQNICKKLESKYWREKIEEGLREKIANQEPQPDDGAEEIELALKEIDHKIDALLDLAEDGQIPLEVRDRLYKRLAEKKNLQKELEKLQNKTRRLENGKHLIPQLMSYLDDSRSVIEQGSNEEKKSLIKEFVGKIEIDKEKRIADCYFYKIPPFVHEPTVCASVTGRDFDMDVNSVQKGTGNS